MKDVSFMSRVSFERMYADYTLSGEGYYISGEVVLQVFNSGIGSIRDADMLQRNYLLCREAVTNDLS